MTQYPILEGFIKMFTPPAQHHDPVYTTTLHRPDGTIEYLLKGPTEGSLMGPVERLKLSFPLSDIYVGKPCMSQGNVEVRVLINGNTR